MYVLCEGGQLPTEEILAAVASKLNAKTVRPLTDVVEVHAPEIISYDVDATIYLSHEPTASQVISRCGEAVTIYRAWQEEKLGRDLNPSKLITLLMSAGAKRVEVRQPTFGRLNANEVAQFNASNVMFTYEDD